MNAMNMPGFTAETSLYKTSESYRLSAGHANYAGAQMAIPQWTNQHCHVFLRLSVDAAGVDDAWSAFWYGAFEGCLGI